MFRRILNITVLLAFLGAASWAGYKFFFENRGPNHEPIKATPANAVAFLTGNNLVEFYRETDNTSLLWQDIKASGYIAQFDNQLDIWNIIDKKGAFKNMKEAPFILSFHPAGIGKMEYLLSVSLPGKTPEMIADMLRQGNMTMRAYKNGIQIIKSPNALEWFYYNFDNLVVFSPSADLILASKRECEDDSPKRKFAGFYKLRPTIGDHVKSSFFIRNNEYIGLLAPHFNAELETIFTQYNTGEAGLYDLAMEPNAIVMRGFNWAPDSLNTKLNLLEGQKPVKPELVKMLPANTQWFYYLGLSDFELFTDKLHNDLEMLRHIEDFNGAYDVNLRQHLLSWAEGQMVYFNSMAYPKERLLIVEADESKHPLREIEFLANRLDSSNADAFDYKGKVVRRLRESNLFGLLLGDIFKNLNNPYYMQYDKYIVFATSPDALIDYFTQISGEQFLARDVQFYDNLENHFSTGTNILFHTDFKEGNEAWRMLDSVKGNLLRDIPFIKNTSSFTYSLACKSKELFYSQAVLKYKGSASSTTNTIWDVSFDTLLQNTPHIIDNHITGTKNIVIQDRANVLHSLSATGKTEFTVPLGEKIVGEIVNVDIHNNGKKQLLFVTPKKLHIIDLKGKYLPGFPVNIGKEATSTPAAYDYESDGNYRILIPCGSKIANYNKEGKPVSGFLFSGLPANITQAPEFQRIDNKDYLFICDEAGNVKLTDRKGVDRYTVTFKLKNRAANKVHFEKGATVETSKIVYCTNNGHIYKQFLNGMLDSLPGKTHIKNGYAFLDTDDDGTNELVVVDSSKIRFLDFKGTVIREVSPLCSDFQLQAYKAGHGLSVIGGTCKSDEVITAFDNMGNDVARIKLTADSPFRVADINNDNKFEIIYCYKNRIFVYTLR
ncbi:MAG TPA: hypothetical protein VK177_07810 [Flavobacteriales bacterium]|nr:hypothetical protein [Flavobacteriales bacterium]